LDTVLVLVEAVLMRNYTQDDLHQMGVIELASLWEENRLRQEAKDAGFLLAAKGVWTCIGFVAVAITLQWIGAMSWGS
jgi:hypothetical protein